MIPSIFAAAGVGLLPALLLLLLQIRFARRTKALLHELGRLAACVARFDFSQRAPVEEEGDLGELAQALNEMAARLGSRFQELSGEKSELAAVLSSMTEGVLVVDASQKIRLTNEALREQFRVGGNAAGKSALEVFRHLPLQDMVAAAAQGKAIASRELTVLTPAEKFFEVNAVTLRDAREKAIGAVVVFHDITRIKRLENSRKDFVANVSHELRTPLSIIKGYVETLLEEPSLKTETCKQFLRTIQKHSTRLEALIGDLLAISALESQKTKPTLESVSLRESAETVLEELASRAKSRSISISMEIPETTPPVAADSKQLHQAIFNLVDNAVKYIQTGGKIILSASEKNMEVEFCVRDNGPGIFPEHLPHLFERFYRVDRARSRDLGGTGLGLSIVKHVIQAHGGRVWAESQPDHGSSFYFTLPRAC